MKTFQKPANFCSKFKWRMLWTALILIILVPFSALAQNEGRIWFFGFNAGLNFNTNPPSPLPGSAIVTSEGCATICDSSGNLLFYTNGITVWNRNHTVMPNGTGLMGHSSSTQSGIIVPDPGNPNKYYVFEVDDYNNSDVYYSRVDMTLDGGLGDVEPAGKSTPLLLGTDESVTAIRSSNNTFWWIITHQRATNNWYAFRLTSAGINTGSPVISAVGTATPVNGDVGHIKANAAGTRLAMNAYLTGWTEVYDFNNATGAVSNPINLSQTLSYGAEFSPDGNILYVCGIGQQIYQYNLLAGSPALIYSTRYAVNASATDRAALQLGPDGKIYVAVYNSTTLDVINDPNTIGAGCNYTLNSQAIAGTCRLGLPNFIASFISAPPRQDVRLRISAGAGGTTNPEPGNHRYPINSNIQVTAIPDIGYAFSGWDGDVPAGMEKSSTLTIRMNGNKELHASFEKQYSLTMNINNGGYGTTDPGPGTHWFKSGSIVPILAIPAAHYEFCGWSGDVPTDQMNDNPLALAITEDKTLSVCFRRKIYGPGTLIGEKVLNRSLAQAEYISVLKWTPNANNVDITKYRIYRIENGSQTLAGEVNANTHIFLDRKVLQMKEYTYAVVAVNSEDREGAQSTVLVK